MKSQESFVYVHRWSFIEDSRFFEAKYQKSTVIIYEILIQLLYGSKFSFAKKIQKHKINSK